MMACPSSEKKEFKIQPPTWDFFFFFPLTTNSQKNFAGIPEAEEALGESEDGEAGQAVPIPHRQPDSCHEMPQPEPMRDAN